MFAIGDEVSIARLNDATVLQKVRSPLVIQHIRGQMVRAMTADEVPQPVWVSVQWLDPVKLAA